jgi:hypothetical protein
VRSRKNAKKGGYTAHFDSLQDETIFMQTFLEYINSGIPCDQKIDRIANFLKSVPHLRFILEHGRFRVILRGKLMEWASETEVPPDFHTNRLQALDYLRQFRSF